MAAEETAREELIEQVLAEFVLPVGGAFVDRGTSGQLISYIVESLDIKDVATVRALGSEAFVEAMQDLDSGCKGLPLRMVRARAEFYCGEKTVAKPLNLTAARTSLTSTKLSSRPKKATIASDTEDDEPDNATTRSAVDPASKKGKQFIRDQEVTGMTPDENQAYDATLHAGLLVEPSALEGIPLGTSISTSEWGRKMAKNADHATLSQKISKGDAEAVTDHFLNLIRLYNEEGLSKECTCVTLFHTKTEEMFLGDPVGRLRYIKWVREKYSGRGTPFPDGFDIALIVRGMRVAHSSAASDKAEMASLKTALGMLRTRVDACTGDLGNLKTENQRLKQRLGSLEGGSPAKGAGLKGGGRGGRGLGGGRGNASCNYCGETGHWARDCPLKAAEETTAITETEE